MTAKLTVAISTIGHRINQLSQIEIPQSPNVEFLILWQKPTRLVHTIEHLTARNDVALHSLHDQTGVAFSRTEAIKRAKTPFLLFADDDMEFHPPGWKEIIHQFEKYADLDILCARLRTSEGEWRKAYGSESLKTLRPWNILRVGTPELALRLESIKSEGLSFDSDFGAGTTNLFGDEAVFLSDALRAGLCGVHAPIQVGIHPIDSSGVRFDSASIAARVVLIKRCFGAVAPLARLAFALKHAKRFPTLLTLAQFVVAKVD